MSEYWWASLLIGGVAMWTLFHYLDLRFNWIGKKLDSIDSRLDSFESTLQTLREDIDAIGHEEDGDS